MRFGGMPFNPPPVAVFPGSLSVNGDVTLGDASGDEVVINAGSLVASNANIVENDNSIVNVGTLEARSIIFEPRLIFTSVFSENPASVGTGVVSKSDQQLVITSGTTAGGISSAEAIIRSENSSQSTIRWDYQVSIGWLSVLWRDTVGSLEIESKALLGRGTGDTGPLDDKGIGIKLTDRKFYGVYHNGTDGGETLLSVSYNQSAALRWCIISTAGSIKWYCNGILVGSISSGGPTGTSTSGHNFLQFQSQNGAVNFDGYMLVQGINYISTPII